MTFNVKVVENLLKDEPEALAVLNVAINNIETGANRIFAISGKKGSGKDTFAEQLAKTRGADYISEAYARSLKVEAGQMFDRLESMYGYYTEAYMVADLIAKHELAGIPGVEDNMKKLVSAVCDDFKAGIKTNSYKRSPGAWAALSLLGTNIRRAKDDNYWVKKTVADTVLAVAKGQDVYISDARFPNELEAAIAMDAVTIRMVVSPEVQRQRLLGRDGSLPTEEALNYPSETALDDCKDFDFFVDNDGGVSIEDNVSIILDKVSLQNDECKV